MPTKRTPKRRDSKANSTPEMIAVYAIVYDTYDDENWQDEYNQAGFEAGLDAWPLIISSIDHRKILRGPGAP
jgi:predicted heme/steroid binding protein